MLQNGCVVGDVMYDICLQNRVHENAQRFAFSGAIRAEKDLKSPL